MGWQTLATSGKINPLNQTRPALLMKNYNHPILSRWLTTVAKNLFFVLRELRFPQHVLFRES
jgi:hypothetical protein